MRDVARLVLNANTGESPPTNDPIDAFAISDPNAIGTFRQNRLVLTIHQTRHQLAIYPRNPVLWSNLALLYSSVGSLSKALRAMVTALDMAPNNRFILRAASRMFLHQGNGHRAHWLLERAANVSGDPWILAAEIAISAATNRTSRHIRKAKHLLERKGHSPLHLSELASALGTMEAREGNRRQGRKHIEQSLVDPSENAIAQAAWLARQDQINTSVGDTTKGSAEALAWKAFRDGDWTKAMQAAEEWLCDQPFSSRPAMLGSHILATINEDFGRAVEFTGQGVRSNPDDASLLNNLAFAQVMAGDSEAAQRTLHRVDVQTTTPAKLRVIAATKGLIAFRDGRPENGRQLYRASVEALRTSRDPNGAIAHIYWALEEVAIGSDIAERVRSEAIEAANGRSEKWCEVLIQRLRDATARNKYVAMGQP